MSQETKWQRVALRMVPLMEVRSPGTAFRILGKLLSSEPAASAQEEFECLVRATSLVSVYGNVDLARKWTEEHRTSREREGPLSESATECYKLVRVAFELAGLSPLTLALLILSSPLNSAVGRQRTSGG